MKTRSSRRIIMSVLLVALMLTSVAYAILQTTLNISGTVTKKGGTWDIHFANLGTPVLGGTGTSQSAAIDSNTTNFTFGATLAAPGDSVTYNFDVVNGGSLDAVISSIVFSGINEAKEEDISVSFTYAATGKTVAKNDTLKSGETKALNLVVSYDNVETLSGSDVALNLSATLIYSQDNGTAGSGEGEGTLEFESYYYDGDEVYFNPETGSLCADYTTTQSNDGVKNGCMKWYAYNDTGTTLNLFLDHNTTNDVAWQSSGDTRNGIGEVQTQLESDTTTWQDSLGARLITRDELVEAGVITGEKTSTWTESLSYSWYSGNYWTSTPLPSNAVTEDGCDIFSNGFNYYEYAFAMMTHIGVESLFGPPITESGIVSCPNDINWTYYFEVENTSQGVRPVITITR